MFLVNRWIQSTDMKLDSAVLSTSCINAGFFFKQKKQKNICEKDSNYYKNRCSFDGSSGSWYFLKKNPWGVHPVGWNRVWLEKSGLVEPHNGVGSPGQSCWLRKLLVGPPPRRIPSGFGRNASPGRCMKQAAQGSGWGLDTRILCENTPKRPLRTSGAWNYKRCST